VKTKTVSFAIAAVAALIGFCWASAPATIGFSVRSIKGNYAGVFEGVVLQSGTLVHVVGSGIFIADGRGNLSGHESYVYDGTPCSVTLQGTYSVNVDGSGSDSISLLSATPDCAGSFTQSLAIGESGRVIVFSNSGANQEVTATWRQQGLPY
jgi:hypothetical protein